MLKPCRGTVARKLASLFSLAILAVAPMPLRVQAEPLRVGIPRDTSPCASWQKGLAAGSSVEHWRAAAEVSGLAYQAQPVASIADGLARVRGGELDLLVSCLNITPQRLRLVEFTVPVSEDGLALVGREGTVRDLLAILLPILASTAVVSLLLLVALSGLTTLAVWFVEGGFHHSDVNAKDGKVSRPFFKAWVMLFSSSGLYKMGYSKRAMSFVAVNALAGRVVFALFVSSVTALVASRAVDASLSNRTGEMSFSDGESVAVLRGSAADDWLATERERGATDVTPRRFDSMQEIVQALDRDAVDQALIDQRAAAELLQQDAQSDLRILAEHPLRFYQAFAVSNGLNSEQLARINIGISQIQAVEHYEQ